MIGNDRYVVEMVDDAKLSTNKYRVLRNTVMINDNTIDSDLYFIDKDIDLENIIWPQSDLSNTPLMSTNSKTFNQSFVSNSEIYDAIDHGMLIDDEMYEKNVKTIKLRIWHPTTSIRRDMIIYCDSWINSVHYHWAIKKLMSGKSQIGKEKRLNQDIYNEYFEIEIPDWRDLLFNNTFIEGNFSIVKNQFSEKKTKYVKPRNKIDVQSIHKDNDVKLYDVVDIPDEECNQLIDLHLELQKWKYNENSREYVDDGNDAINGIGINVTLYPWDYISDAGTYLIDNYAFPASCRFSEELKFSIKETISLSENQLFVIGRIQYPDIFLSVKNAWQSIYNTDFSKYKELSEKASKDEEAMEMLGNNPSMVKYSCIIGSDYNLTQIIHEETAYSNTIDDFKFPLKDLFSDWSQVPNGVYIKLVIEDRAIGRGCSSPTIMITKEKLRYTIVDTPYTRISLNAKQTNISEMNKENFNFIDKISCRIVKNDISESKSMIKGTSSPRMIYKPIFFKTQDLQNIKLRSNLQQNIGISLSEYMTKVEEFILRIESNDYHEIARNNAFVIFKIDVKNISNTIGKYDIITIDGDYISSGNYTIE